MQILDFEILIDGRDGSFTVRVVHSPAGEGREEVTFASRAAELTHRLDVIERGSGTTTDRDVVRVSSKRDTSASARSVGAELFDTFITGEVLACLDDSLRAIEPSEESLRLKLRIEAPELASLPWEFLLDGRESGGRFFALSRRTPLVRYLPVRGAVERLSVSGTLRVLAMAAQPADLGRLDVSHERRLMETAVAPLVRRGRMRLDWVDGQDWPSLQRALRNGPWHVFHFIGHGSFDEKSGEGYLALGGASADAPHERLLAPDLAALLANDPNLRLVVLNSCDGARGGVGSIFSSTAATLVAAGGVPAVVAMQYAISDSAAKEFSRVFYESLADGQPVDASVAESRTAIKVRFPERIEWATPVLYMRSPDGDLFDIKPNWHTAGTAWLAIAAAAVVVFGFLAPTAFWDAPTLSLNIAAGTGALAAAAGPLALRGVREWVKRVTAIVGHTVPVQGVVALLVCLVALFAWRSGVPALAESLTACGYAHVECLEIGAFEGRSEQTDYSFLWTTATQETLYQKLAQIPGLRVHQTIGEAECGDLCVQGRFAFEEGAYQLVAMPASDGRKLGDVILRSREESYGIILRQWHALADSLLDRFGITASAGLRDSLRHIPTTDSTALRLNNEGVMLALEAGSLDGEARLGALDRALAAFDSAIAIDPRYASPHANKGGVHMLRSGEYFLAAEEYQAAIRLLAGYAPYHYQLGRAYLEMGPEYRSRALRQMEMARDLDPRFVQARHDLAVEYLLAGDHDAARVELDAALAIDSTFVPLRLNRGRLALRSGNIEAARPHLEYAEAAWRDDASARYDEYIHAVFLLARVEQAGADTPRACSWIERARDRDPVGISPWADSVSIVAAGLGCS